MKNHLTIWKNQHRYELEWQRKAMKRYILKYKEGRFILSTPLHASKQDVMAWLEHIDEGQLLRLVHHHKIKRADDFVYLFGKRYELVFHSSPSSKAVLDDKTITVYGDGLDAFLEEQLRAYARQRLDRYEQLGYSAFHVTLELQAMSSRYGVCFCQKKKIKLAKSLVHEPPEVIDAIIIHELGHFYYPNHSSQFYEWVYARCPKYETIRLFLKQGGIGDGDHYFSE